MTLASKIVGTLDALIALFLRIVVAPTFLAIQLPTAMTRGRRMPIGRLF